MNSMLGMEYILGLSMGLVNIYKKSMPPQLVPFVTIGVALGLNMLNAFIFDGNIQLAAKDAIITAGIASGLFAAGDGVRKVTGKVSRK